MSSCPKCGKELGAGVTRCWNPGCDAVLLAPAPADSKTSAVVKSDRLRELEMEYDLATRGLNLGASKTFAAIFSGFATLVASALVLGLTGKQLLGGWQLVAVFGIIALAIIIYYSFVFGRAFKIKADIGKERRRLELEAGKKVR